MTAIQDVTIGGSEVFELLERPQYSRGCARALAYRKLQVEPDFPPPQDDPILARGTRLEPIAADIYAEITGRKLWKVQPNRVHKRFPWARVSTDRAIVRVKGAKSVGDLELKTRAEGPYNHVLARGPFPGDSLQIQWSLWVTGHAWGALGVLGVFGSLPMIHFDVEADKELHQVFEEQGSLFAEMVFERGLLPEPTFDATDSRCKSCAWRIQCRGEEASDNDGWMDERITKSGKELVQIENAELTQILTDIDLLKAEREAIDDSIGIAKQKALERIGEVEGAILRNYGKVYRLPIQINTFDQKQLKRDYPDIYERYHTHRLSGGFYLRTYPQ